MPIPLVELLKVDKILNIQETKCQRYTDLVDEKFKKYKYNIWAKENKMLQHLTTLPSNRLPKNKNIVADYQ